MKNFDFWMWAYVIGSIPVLLFYAAGLSGWFFEYPLPLFVTIFILFIVPLALLALNHPAAPAWNLVLVWSAAVLLTIRILWGVQAGDIPMGREEVTMLLLFVCGSMLWAGAWTAYFLKSKRIAQIFR